MHAPATKELLAEFAGILNKFGPLSEEADEFLEEHKSQSRLPGWSRLIPLRPRRVRQDVRLDPPGQVWAGQNSARRAKVEGDPLA